MVSVKARTYSKERERVQSRQKDTLLASVEATEFHEDALFHTKSHQSALLVNLEVAATETERSLTMQNTVEYPL